MITVEGFGSVECRPGQSLLETLTSAGIFMERPCGGQGTCGKCLAKVTRGTVPPPVDEESQLIGAAKLAEGYRLACLLYPAGELTVHLPKARKRHRILTAGQAPKFQFDPSVKKELYQAPKRKVADNRPADQWISRLLGGVNPPAKLNFLKALAPLKLGYVSGEKSFTLVCDSGRPLTVEPGDTRSLVYGLALDIGTTTMVLALVDLLDGRELGSASMINPQVSQGMDILSRIAYAQEHGQEGLRALQAAVVEGVEELAAELCLGLGVAPANIYSMVVAANTTMIHMFLGLAPDSLGFIPFAPTLTRGLTFRGQEIGLACLASTMVSVLPSVSAYIGADIVAGAQACRLKHRRENVLFIDIGTNGEVILASHGQLTSCSCAAGPAFEGMNIHQGMRATDGAVEDLALIWKRESADLHITLKTIGEVKPVGLCGSGVLAAVRELLQVGLVRPDGRLLKKDELADCDPRKDLILEFNGKPAVRLTKGPDEIIITQKDIRQVQLAKGAVLSAIKALLTKTGLSMNALDRVIVAGQFGAYLPVKSLTGCGVIPAELGVKIEYAGNTSKVGAYMALMSQQVRAEMEFLANEIDYFELGSVENYDRLFAAAMRFPLRHEGG